MTESETLDGPIAVESAPALDPYDRAQLEIATLKTRIGARKAAREEVTARQLDEESPEAWADHLSRLERDIAEAERALRHAQLVAVKLGDAKFIERHRQRRDHITEREQTRAAIEAAFPVRADERRQLVERVKQLDADQRADSERLQALNSEINDLELRQHSIEVRLALVNEFDPPRLLVRPSAWFRLIQQMHEQRIDVLMADIREHDGTITSRVLV